MRQLARTLKNAFRAWICLLPVMASDKSLLAVTPKIPSLAIATPAHGIDPAQYDGFWLQWPLITTRYRTDNGEIRFIYANKLAQEALFRGDSKYPDGAVFGKIAFKSSEDLKFPTSLEPRIFTRMQLMVKDSKAFASRDGWGYYLYALRENDGETSYIDACHACHTLVKDRDFVFASPTFLSGVHDFVDGSASFRNAFRSAKGSELSPAEKHVLALRSNKGGSKDVVLQSMPLFIGSLYESIGPMASFARQEDKVFLLFDPKSEDFLLAEAEVSDDKCANRVEILMSRPKTKSDQGSKKEHRQGMMCNGRIQWK
jgi:hypothetical protein